MRQSRQPDAAPPKLDKSVVRVFNSFEEADQADREYWWSKTPEERLRELERLRQLNYGYGQGRPFPDFRQFLESLNSAQVKYLVVGGYPVIYYGYRPSNR
jgi:hypothetical protein